MRTAKEVSQEKKRQSLRLEDYRNKIAELENVGKQKHKEMIELMLDKRIALRILFIATATALQELMWIVEPPNQKTIDKYEALNKEMEIQAAKLSYEIKITKDMCIAVIDFLEKRNWVKIKE